MRTVYLVLFLFATVYAESVRETETWMPMLSEEPRDDLVSSGDSSNGSDFDFIDERESTYDDEEDDEVVIDDDYEDETDDSDYESSGSGDYEKTDTISYNRNSIPSVKPDITENAIPGKDEPQRPRPTVDERQVVMSNEVSLRGAQEHEDQSSNVLMSHAGNESMFSKTEVLAAVIAGCAVGLLFAVLLILLLVYRMKKKDEGSYDLGKKPIYKKAPTTEIYA